MAMAAGAVVTAGFALKVGSDTQEAQAGEQRSAAQPVAGTSAQQGGAGSGFAPVDPPSAGRGWSGSSGARQGTDGVPGDVPGQGPAQDVAPRRQFRETPDRGFSAQGQDQDQDQGQAQTGEPPVAHSRAS